MVFSQRHHNLLNSPLFFFHFFFCSSPSFLLARHREQSSPCSASSVTSCCRTRNSGRRTNPEIFLNISCINSGGDRRRKSPANFSANFDRFFDPCRPLARAEESPDNRETCRIELVL